MLRSLLTRIPVRTSVSHRNLDLSGNPFRLGADEVDGQQSIDEIGTGHLQTIGKQKDPLKLPRGNAAMQKNALPIVLLAAADAELVVFNRDFELTAGESRHSERDP